MTVFSTLALGFKMIFSDPHILMFLTGGTVLGLIFGCIPGLTAALGVALILPFTYAMEPVQGIVTLIGIYVGGISGGLYAAILLNIPGTSASIVTTFDGSPMARNGEAPRALSMGIFASFTGGIISMFFLITIAPQLAKIALVFGPWEYAALGILGLSVVVSLVGEDMVKGLIAAVVGIFLAMVGMDPVLGIPRFTGGIWQLNSGFSIIATLMGFFAVSEMLFQVQKIGRQETNLLTVKQKIPFFPTLKDIKLCLSALGIGSIFGVGIGILPGVGQSTASMLAYSQVKTMSKTPEKFGKGCIEGVAVSESANNAVNGGAMIPMMTLGIPGDVVTSILLGGLVIHGLQPGPLLFKVNADIVGSMFVGYALANILMLVLSLSMIRVFMRLLRVPATILYPIIFVMCVLGTYSINNRIFDIWVLLICGFIGYLLIRNGFSLPPLILGYILGPIIELNYRTAILASGGNPLDVFHYPIALSILALAVVFIVIPVVKQFRKSGTAAHITS